MFEFMDNPDPDIRIDNGQELEYTPSSYQRDQDRRFDWFYDVSFLPIIRYRIWWLIHNCMVHPMLAILPIRLVLFAHDWTGYKLNRLEIFQSSPPPDIPLHLRSYFEWFVHNFVAHIAIGLVPCRTTFKFHDYTAKRMDVNGWT